MDVELVTLADSDALDAALQAMNETGVEPALPFVDARGVANIAYGMAPSGDDWAIGFSTRDPDSGVGHCCECAHEGGQCDAGVGWEPAYPITALRSEASRPAGG